VRHLHDRYYALFCVAYVAGCVILWHASGEFHYVRLITQCTLALTLVPILTRRSLRSSNVPCSFYSTIQSQGNESWEMRETLMVIALGGLALLATLMYVLVTRRVRGVCSLRAPWTPLDSSPRTHSHTHECTHTLTLLTRYCFSQDGVQFENKWAVISLALMLVGTGLHSADMRGLFCWPDSLLQVRLFCLCVCVFVGACGCVCMCMCLFICCHTAVSQSFAHVPPTTPTCAQGHAIWHVFCAGVVYCTVLHMSSETWPAKAPPTQPPRHAAPHRPQPPPQRPVRGSGNA